MATAQEYVTRSFLDGKVELMIPAQLKLMDDEMMWVKYPSERRPQVVYTDKNGTINVALNYTESKATQNELDGYLEAMKESLAKAQPSAEWLGTGMDTVNGRRVGYFELVTPAIDTRIYNLMFFTDVDSRLAIFSFNCTFKYIDEWRNAARGEILPSLLVKQQ